MADDIFDYFGGNSSRKVEPLDESEMFDDLMPGKETPAADEGQAEPEIIEAELIQEGVEQPANDVQEAESEIHTPSEQPAAAESNDPWNDLASSLGLDPVPASRPRERTSVVLGEVGLVADLGANEPEAKETESEQSEVEPPSVRVFDQDDEPADGDESQDVLSEMFVPTEDPEAYARREPVEDLEDDPFAAFSGAARQNDASDEIDDSDESDDVDMEAVDSPEVESDPDFVEFEVTDLAGRAGEEREERAGRRPKRRRRGSNENDETTRFEEDRPKGQRSEREDHREDSHKRRGRRRSRESVEQREDVRDESIRDRESGDRSNDRDRNRKRDRGRDRSVEERDKKKKPRIPTWQEAIDVVIDENIKRHESSAQSGRGGKRRRRN